MRVLDEVIADLRAEGDQLRGAVAGLDESGWASPTPAEGWSVATTIAHLRWTDECAVLASVAHTPQGRRAWDALLETAVADPEGFVDTAAFARAGSPPAELLARWDESRAALAETMLAYPAGEKLPWFGPPMSATSMLTARFMETWAHGLDVYDALVARGDLPARPAATDRVRHVVHLGIRARDFSFATAGAEAPAEEFRVELRSPSGVAWSWGPESAAQRVTGSAYDFAQLVTQRIHRDDTDLRTVGADAERWLRIAQSFAGPAGGGRAAVGGGR